MQVHVLASGSSGNAIFIKKGSTSVLIDAGISAKRIKSGLAAVGSGIEDVDAVFLTHEHSDHVSGLTNLLKKHRLPIYATEGTWQALADKDKLPAECYRCLDAGLNIGAMKIEHFSILHDAAEPVGFNIFAGTTKCTVATDLGYVSESVKKALANSDIMILEANHDVDLLKDGSYPWFLKQRILSNRGHLSNNDAGWTLAKLPRKDNMHVFLAHLSKENNNPQVAHQTISGILSNEGITVGTEITLQLTFPDTIASFKS